MRDQAHHVELCVDVELEESAADQVLGRSITLRFVMGWSIERIGGVVFSVDKAGSR